MAQLADDDVDRLALPLLVRAANLLHESFVITTSGDDGRGYRVLFVNDEFTRMTGYGREEVLGCTLGLLQGPETDPAEIERLDRELAAGEDFDGRAINYRKDGSRYLVEWSIRPIRDESGRITHFFSVQRAGGARTAAGLDGRGGVVADLRRRRPVEAGGSADLDIDIAAAGNTAVVRSKMEVMENLGLDTNIEDILITLGSQYHLIRPLHSSPGLFLYCAFDRKKSNLAMTCHKLAAIEAKLEV